MKAPLGVHVRRGARRYGLGVILVVVGVVAGAAIGFALPRVPLHRVKPTVGTLWPLAVALVAQLVLPVVPTGPDVVVAMLSLVALLAVAIANRHLIGIAVIGVGALCNLAGLVVNVGLPVDPDALVAAGVVERSELATVDPGPARHLQEDGDPLPWLGDVVPVEPLHAAVSFGDLIVAMGLGDTVASLTRRRRRAAQPAAASDDRTVRREPVRAEVAARAEVADPAADRLWPAIRRRRQTQAASADHDWGTAPSAAPSSGSQCSEKPDERAPRTIDLTKEMAAAFERARELAKHSK